MARVRNEIRRYRTRLPKPDPRGPWPYVRDDYTELTVSLSRCVRDDYGNLHDPSVMPSDRDHAKDLPRRRR